MIGVFFKAISAFFLVPRINLIEDFFSFFILYNALKKKKVRAWMVKSLQIYLSYNEKVQA